MSWSQAKSEKAQAPAGISGFPFVCKPSLPLEGSWEGGTWQCMLGNCLMEGKGVGEIAETQQRATGTMEGAGRAKKKILHS